MKRELLLAASMLKMASDEFGDHICNDFELPDSWTQQECDDFILAMETWNGDTRDYQPGSRLTQDYFVMSYLASRILGCAEDIETLEQIVAEWRSVAEYFGCNTPEELKRRLELPPS